MVSKNINDEKKWAAFVEKLISATQEGKIKWEDFCQKTNRERVIGSIFVATIVANKFVAVYRYTYDYYTDVDEYTEHEEIAIELVDNNGEKLWRLPNVNQRYSLIDLLEFKSADADRTFEAFINDAA